MAAIAKSNIIQQIIALIILVIICTIVGQGITFLLLKYIGLDVKVGMLSDDITAGTRQLARVGIAIGHLISFTVSGCLFLYFFHKKNYPTFLKSNKTPEFSLFLISFFLILFCYPLIGKLAEWNMTWDLPEWAQTSSASAQDLLKGLLKMESPKELIFNIFLVGITPAIGEELIYRGILQNKFKSVLRNEHIAILLASFLFSLNHFQIDRLIPFTLLGLLLGYAYHYSRNFWIPVILHFVNNSLQVVMLYSAGDMISDMDLNQTPDVPLPAVYFSIFTTLALFLLLRHTSSKLFNEQEPKA